MKSNQRKIARWVFVITTVLSSIQVYAASKGIVNTYLFEEIDVTLDAEPGIRIEVEHSWGNIEIRQGENTQIVIHGEKRAGSRTTDIAQNILDNMKIIAERKGDTVSIRTVYPDELFKENNTNHFSLSYVIEIPEQVTLEIENSYGNIQLQSLSGDFTVRNQHGDVSTSELVGGIRLNNKYGSLSVERIIGDVVLSNEHGSITCADISNGVVLENAYGPVVVLNAGKNVKIRNSHGALSVEKVGGHADLETEYESIDCNDIGGTADIRNTHGPVTVRNIKNNVTVRGGFKTIIADDIDGDFEAQNQHGGVTATNITGNIDIKTSFGPVAIDTVGGDIGVVNQQGSIIVTGIMEQAEVSKQIILKTSHDSIRLLLPETASATVTAGTLQGHITYDFPILMNPRKNNISKYSEHFTGTIGDGKDNIELENTYGSIYIEKLINP